MKKTKLNKTNVNGKVKAQAGIYRVYNCGGKLQYVGRSKNIKRRLQRYYQKTPGYLAAHPTKQALRKDSCLFTVSYMPIQKARKVEKRTKQKAPHNHL